MADFMPQQPRSSTNKTQYPEPNKSTIKPKKTIILNLRVEEFQRFNQIPSITQQEQSQIKENPKMQKGKEIRSQPPKRQNPKTRSKEKDRSQHSRTPVEEARARRPFSSRKKNTMISDKRK